MISPLNKLKDLSSQDQMSSTLSYWDKNFICRFADLYFFKWFNRSYSESIGVILLSDLLELDYSQHIPFIQKVVEGQFQSYEYEMSFFTGHSHIVISTYYPDVKNGNFEGFYLHMSIRDRLFKNNVNPILDYYYDNQMHNVGEFLKTQILSGFPSIEYLANKHFLSVSKLMRDFKNTYHTSPFIYFRKLQMEFARNYINETGCSKKRIALMLGFSNPGNFTNCYKRWEGNQNKPY